MKDFDEPLYMCFGVCESCSHPCPACMDVEVEDVDDDVFFDLLDE